MQKYTKNSKGYKWKNLYAFGERECPKIVHKFIRKLFCTNNIRIVLIQTSNGNRGPTRIVIRTLSNHSGQNLLRIPRVPLANIPCILRILRAPYYEMQFNHKHMLFKYSPYLSNVILSVKNIQTIAHSEILSAKY